MADSLGNELGEIERNTFSSWNLYLKFVCKMWQTISFNSLSRSLFSLSLSASLSRLFPNKIQIVGKYELLRVDIFISNAAHFCSVCLNVQSSKNMSFCD